MNPKARLFWPLLLAVFTADCASKQWADSHLVPEHTPHNIIGDFVRFTLAHNPGAAMSISLGEHSRVGFSLLTLVAIGMMLWMYLRAPVAGRLRVAALGLVMGGAIGNLTSRLISAQGVTDFIDVGTRAWRFWTFNVADIAISVGAFLLIYTVWEDERSAGAGGVSQLGTTGGHSQ